MILDDILTVSKGLEKKHLKMCSTVFTELIKKILRLTFQKQEIHCLGYHISQSRFLPMESKTSSVLSLETPKILEKLRSFLGSVQNIYKNIIPNLAKISHPLRPLLQKSV